MRVVIATQTHEFAMDIGLQEPVSEIKLKIEQFSGIPATLQILSVSGWELLDGLDMDDYPIVAEGTRIDLMTKSCEQYPLARSSKIQIIIKFSARQISVEVDATDTVGSLKEKIHILEGTPIKRMRLYFSGVELEDFRNLGEYGISQFSEIVVFLKAANRTRDQLPVKRLSVVVQTSSSLLNSASIPLELRDMDTVHELKELLLTRKILPMDDYLFIHKQRIMRENCSLRWHGVEDGDSLYVFRGTVSREPF